MMLAGALMVMLSCTGEQGEEPPPPPMNEPNETADTGSPTTDTGPTTSDPTVKAVCERDANNALRASCQVQATEAISVTLTLSAPGVPTRTFESSDEMTNHTLFVWGLVPDTNYTWTVGDITGTLTTGSLPQALQPNINVQGDASAFTFDAVMRPLECRNGRYSTMIDTEGRIIWYEPIPDDYALWGYGSFNWSQEHQTVLIASAAGFIETNLSGNIVLRLDPGVHYSNAHMLHHDVDRWGNFRYLLFQYDVDGFLVDGVHVFEGDTLRGTWFMDDHFTVGGGNPDWSHGNGINVNDDGTIVLSFLSFDAVVALDGDPNSPTFLDILWHAAGAPETGLPNPDFIPTGQLNERFRGQHNASLVNDDLWVFDNASQGMSRALRMSMDASVGLLTVTGSWSMEEFCPIQGGALPIDGGVLATCATSGQARAFRENATTSDWSLRSGCQGRPELNRAIPVSFDTPVSRSR
ncbi:MAG: hypothetical protein AAGA48_21875 [Myxococcota bacterium]